MDPTAEHLIGRLRRNPDDSEAFGALRAHYHQRGDYPSLANLLEGWAARARDGFAAAAAYHEAAELCRMRLGDGARALALDERALERDPTHMEASTRVQEALEQVGDHRRLVDLFERRALALAESSVDPRYEAQAHHQVGEIHERLGRIDRAVAAYRKAMEVDPGFVQSIYAAREIYRNAGNLKAAASLYEKEADAETSPERKIALLRELAHMRAEQLHDLEGAVAALERALEQAPTDLSVMHDLATSLLRHAESRHGSPVGDVDRRRAAELLFQMSQSVPTAHALAYAEAALDACADHDRALRVLEQIAPGLGREDILPMRWVAYLQAVPDAPGSDDVRRRLGRAYLEAGQAEDAMVCWEPLLERGDAEAAVALVDLYRHAGREADLARALGVAVRTMPADKRVPRLREIVRILVGQDDSREAEARCREILDLEPSDAEALALLEAALKGRGAFRELRDLLTAAARVHGLSAEMRKSHLREVASISEDELDDPEGAISAWRAISTLDPADGSARKALERLLERTERWDELVQVLERQALSLTDPDEKAEVYRRLAHVHRDHRDSPMEAVGALRHLRDIRPGDLPARDELCDLLVRAGAHLEAVPLLRQRVDAAPREERVPLLRRLADLLEKDIGDDEGAFETCTRLLDEEPSDIDAIDRLERIDARAGRWERLLETLSYRTEVVPHAERAQVLRQMGHVAEAQLRDLDRAAEYYVKALDLRPEDTETLDALVGVYDRAERYREVVVLLKDRAKLESDVTARAELYRRIARMLGDRVRNEDGAAEAWHEVLTAGEDREALVYLRLLAEKRQEPAELKDVLGRLARLEDDPVAKRDLLLAKAETLARDLGADAEAIDVLREVVETVDPTHLASLARLSELCERTGDHAKHADALERRLALTTDEGLRVPIARKLADLYEQALDDRPRAVAALQAWSDADLTDPEPQRRLAALLELSERWVELIDVLDALSGIVQEPEESGALVRRAARLAIDHKGDVDWAWSRLVPRVEEEDAESEQALRELAREVARGEPLAEVYVRLAQEASQPSVQRRRWTDAAGVFEGFLGDPDRAVEAMLRAFATDLDDDGMLGEVDRLATAGGSWERLSQVYDTLLKRAADDARKVELLLRHAGLLESGMGDASAALDRVLRATALAPDDDRVLARAEALAPRAGRAEELLIVYDRRRARATDDAGRVDALLRAARVADLSQKDRDRTLVYLAQAVSLTLADPALAEAVEATARALDDERPDLGTNALQLALVDIYRRLAERAAGDEAEAGATLLQRASRLLSEELGDEARAYQYLKQAASLSPSNDAIVDALEEFSERTGRLGELEKHLAQLVEEALDPGTAARLLARRGQILEMELGRFSEAADAWSQLLALRSTDPEAAHRVRNCLKQAGRHQDLVGVLEREAQRARDEGAQVAILKEIARTWEVDLGNRWEAIDAWKRVRSARPGDADAEAAVQRLGHSTRRLSADEVADLEADVALEGLGPQKRDEAPLPGAPGLADGSGEHTDPSLAAAARELEFDDETDMGEAAGSVRPGPSSEPAASEVGTPRDLAEALLAATLADRPAPTRDVSTTLEEPLDDFEAAIAAPPPPGRGPTAPAVREITSELELAEVDELDGVGASAFASAPALPASAFGLPDLAPVPLETTGEIDASELLEVSADATGELDALDLEELPPGVLPHSVQAAGDDLVELSDDQIVALDEDDVSLEEGTPRPARSSVPPPPPGSGRREG